MSGFSKEVVRRFAAATKRVDSAQSLSLQGRLAPIRGVELVAIAGVGHDQSQAVDAGEDVDFFTSLACSKPDITPEL